MVGHHGNTEGHSGAPHSGRGELMVTFADPLASDEACPANCEIFHKIKWVDRFSRNKTWRVVCSGDLAIKPWTEAECVVDLILVCAVQVSGKFVLYNRVILAWPHRPHRPHRHIGVEWCWMLLSTTIQLQSLLISHRAQLNPTLRRSPHAPCPECEPGYLVFLPTKNCKTWWPAG